MTSARTEWTGVGAALLLHVALIAALSMSLARMDRAPEPPSMQVDIVDEVALESVAPQAVAEPGGSPPPPDAAIPEDVPEPDQVAPVTPPPPTPRAVPQPAIKPTPPRPPQKAAAKPKPPAPKTVPKAAIRASQRPAPRAGLGDDFLEKLGDDLSPRAGPSKPAAATVSANQMASIVSVIRRRIQPCANRQINPGPGANQIKVRLRIQLLPNGQLRRSPQVLSTSGVDAGNEQYEERVKDLAIATFVGCSPLRGLPPELYEKGWSNFIMSYNLP